MSNQVDSQIHALTHGDVNLWEDSKAHKPSR